MTQQAKHIQAPLPFEVRNAVKDLGERIRVARIRRRMSQDELADACGIGRRTLYRIESGETGIAVGNIFAVLWKLGLLGTARSLADPDQDEHGKILEAARMPRRVRASAAVADNDF
jgi:transcriptional regulator with XRE-family HTH domain